MRSIIFEPDLCPTVIQIDSVALTVHGDSLDWEWNCVDAYVRIVMSIPVCLLHTYLNTRIGLIYADRKWGILPLCMCPMARNAIYVASH